MALENCRFYSLLLPSSLKCLFSKTNRNHNHITRQATTGITTVHLDQAILPIMHFAPSSWNTHCRQIQQSSSLRSFSHLFRAQATGGPGGAQPRSQGAFFTRYSTDFDGTRLKISPGTSSFAPFF